ncbi:hypothetical protein LXL04_030247 [Taraxacum kok-saghyz]
MLPQKGLAKNEVDDDHHEEIWGDRESVQTQTKTRKQTKRRKERGVVVKKEREALGIDGVLRPWVLVQIRTIIEFENARTNLAHLFFMLKNIIYNHI